MIEAAERAATVAAGYERRAEESKPFDEVTAIVRQRFGPGRRYALIMPPAFGQADLTLCARVTPAEAKHIIDAAIACGALEAR